MCVLRICYKRIEVLYAKYYINYCNIIFDLNAYNSQKLITMKKTLLIQLHLALIILLMFPSFISAQETNTFDKRYQEELANDKLGIALRDLKEKIVIEGITFAGDIKKDYKARLKSSELLIIKAEAIPSAGYTWVLKDEGKSSIEVISEDFEPSKIAGGNVIKRFVIRSKVKGEITLNLEYKRPWEKLVAPLSVVTITIQSEGAYTGNFSMNVSTKSSLRKLRKADYTVRGLPSSFDWRNHEGKNCITPVKNQGNSNACWAFGTSASFEGVIKAKTGIERDLSEQWLGNCNVHGFSVKDGGWFPQYMFVEYGAVSESEVPFTQTNGICRAPYFYLEKAEEWGYVDGKPDKPWPQETHNATVEQLKKALVTYGPLAIDVYTTGGGKGWYGYEKGVYSENNTGGGHIVCLVGWEDSNECWIIKNSWGPNWGENGYIRVKYNTSGVGAYSAYIKFNPTLKKYRILASSGKIRETPDNDGALQNITLTIEGAATFKNSEFTAADYTFNKLPAGVTAQIKRIGDAKAEIVFTGKAQSHSATDDVNDFTVTFAESAFNGISISDIYNPALTLPIKFRNPYQIIYKELKNIGASFGKVWTAFDLGYFNGSYGAWYFNTASHPDKIGNLKIETYGKKLVCHRGAFNIKALNFGDIIDSKSYWKTYDDFPNQLELTNKEYTDWVGKMAYLGFVLDGDGGPCYGWMRVSVSDDAKSFTIHDFAFNEAPNKPIRAGEKPGGLKSELIYTPDAIEETLDNDGRVTPMIKAVLNGKTFAEPFGKLTPNVQYKISDLPQGLQLDIYAINANSAEIKITGKAINHSDIAKFNLEFLDAAFADGSAQNMNGSPKAFSIHFKPAYEIIHGDFTNVGVSSTSSWSYFALEKNFLPFGAWYFNGKELPELIGDLKLEAYSTELLSNPGTLTIKYVGAGEIIGPQGKEFNTYGGVYGKQHTLVGKTYRTFVGQTGFIGFRFPVEDRYCYGWLKVKVNPDGAGYQVLSFAYNERPNSPLKAGSIDAITENVAPVFDSKPVQNASIGKLYEYNISYSDADPSQKLVLTAETIPDWLKFTVLDNGKAKLEGTPALKGIYNVRLILSDGIATTYQQFSINAEPAGINNTGGIVYVQSNTIAKNNATDYWKSISIKDMANVFYNLYTSGGTVAIFPNTDISFALCTTAADKNLVMLDENVEVGAKSKGEWVTKEYANLKDWKGKTKFIGIRFKENEKANIHYGWMRISVDNNETVTLIDYAYQKTPDAPILTGQKELEKPNREPEFSSLPKNYAFVGKQYVYNIKVIDPDGEPVTLSSLNLPSWLSLSGWKNGDAVLSGTPNVSGNYEITLSATDGVKTQKQIFTLNVGKAALVYNKTNLKEALKNDGSFDESIIATLDNGSFMGLSQTLYPGQHYNVSGLPQGLSLKLEVIKNNEIKISVLGKLAEPDKDATFTLTFTSLAFNNIDAKDVANSSVKFNLKTRPAYRIISEKLTDIVANNSKPWSSFKTLSNQYFGAWYFNNETIPELIGNLKIEAYENDLLSIPEQGYKLKLINSGEEIGPNSVQWNYYDAFPHQHDIYNKTFKDFLGKQAFVGFRYPINTQEPTQYSYGWMKVQVNADGSGFSILEYAYNEAPDMPIMTGSLDPASAFTLKYMSAEGGSVKGSTTQTVEKGKDATPVEAIANAGYKFVKWSDGITQNPRTDKAVSADISVTAQFAVNTYVLNYSAGANGTITGTTLQTVNHGANGTEVTAVANAGYKFLKWSDGNAQNPRTDINVMGNISVSAEFAKESVVIYTLTYTAGEGGIIKGAATQKVEQGKDATPVEATANAGYRFVKWSDGVTQSLRTDKAVNADITVVAQFEKEVTVKFKVSYTAGEGGTIQGAATQIIEKGKDATPVEATANAGYKFVKWSDGVTDNPRTDKAVTADITVVAEFAKSIVGHYNITYTSSEGGIIEGNLNQEIEEGKDATPVKAIANVGYKFLEWSDGVIENPRIDKSVKKNATIMAIFEELTKYYIQYWADQGGRIDGNTTQIVAEGQQGTSVTAVPYSGYIFVKWSDGKTENPRTDKASGHNVMIIATFEQVAAYRSIENNANSDVKVYNAMTPDGDGVNDKLYIEGIDRYNNVKLTIFDRSGNIIKVINNLSSV